MKKSTCLSLCPVIFQGTALILMGLPWSLAMKVTPGPDRIVNAPIAYTDINLVYYGHLVPGITAILSLIGLVVAVVCFRDTDRRKRGLRVFAVVLNGLSLIASIMVAFSPTLVMTAFGVAVSVLLLGAFLLQAYHAVQSK